MNKMGEEAANSLDYYDEKKKHLVTSEAVLKAEYVEMPYYDVFTIFF